MRNPIKAWVHFKSKLTSEVLKGLLQFVTISSIYLIVGVYNFADTRFEAEQLLNASFWTNYVVVMSLGFIVLFVNLAWQKMRLKRTGKVADKIAELQELKKYLSEEGYTNKFRAFVEEINRKEKLSVYRNRLRWLKDHTKNQAKIDRYNELLENAEMDIDIVRVKYNKITENTIFNGVSAKSEEEGRLIYTGREGFGKAVVPSIAMSLIIQILILNLVFTPKAISLDTFMNMGAMLVVMTLYLLRGYAFAELSVNVVLYGVLCEREDEVLNFFAEQGVKLEIMNNENYKYKFIAHEISEPAQEARERTEEIIISSDNTEVNL